MNMWQAVTNFGDSYLTLPLAGAIFVWLTLERRGQYALAWLLCLTAASLLVGITKVLYAGWGVQIPALRFTGISGHAMLASAVYPLVAFALSASGNKRFALAATIAGASIATLVSLSRVPVGAHSPSEVFVGWVVGLAVSSAIIIRVRQSERSPQSSATIACAVASILLICYGHQAPIQAWIEHTAPNLARAMAVML